MSVSRVQFRCRAVVVVLPRHERSRGRRSRWKRGYLMRTEDSCVRAAARRHGDRTVAINAGAAALCANNEASASRCRKKKRFERGERGDVGCEDGISIAMRTSEWQSVGKSQVEAVSRCPGLDAVGWQGGRVVTFGRLGHLARRYQLLLCTRQAGRLAGSPGWQTRPEAAGLALAAPPSGAAVVERAPRLWPYLRD